MAVRQMTGQIDVDQSARDMWQFVVGLKGATWPSHGLPRGTPLLVVGFYGLKIVWLGQELNV
jgi:hypothetical protein